MHSKKQNVQEWAAAGTKSPHSTSSNSTIYISGKAHALLRCPGTGGARTARSQWPQLPARPPGRAAAPPPQLQRRHPARRAVPGCASCRRGSACAPPAPARRAAPPPPCPAPCRPAQPPAARCRQPAHPALPRRRHSSMATARPLQRARRQVCHCPGRLRAGARGRQRGGCGTVVLARRPSWAPTASRCQSWLAPALTQDHRGVHNLVVWRLQGLPL